jgi:putative endonuclease
MAENYELGTKGEEIAVTTLVQKGYEILDRNWHFVHKELDIIAKDGNMLVFVEVKTRTMDTFENAKEALTWKKQQFIVDAANAYIVSKEIELEARFDVVSVIFNGKTYKVEHLVDAFYPHVR